MNNVNYGLCVTNAHTAQASDIEFEVKHRNEIKEKQKTKYCVKSSERGHTHTHTPFSMNMRIVKISVVHSQPNEK